MIIGLTGRNGAGKGTVAQWFTERGFRYTSLSDAIRIDLRERGLEVTRDNLIAGGRQLREEGGPGVLAERILRTIPAGENTIVDSVRNPAEVAELRGRPDFVFLEVTADERTRYERMLVRNRGGDATSFEEFRRHEQAELHSTDSAAQQLVATAALADLQFGNDSDLADLHSALAAVFPTVRADSDAATAPLPDVDVVITGGAGFIGADIARNLLTSGRSVRCVDIAGFNRLADVRDDPNLQFVVGDIRAIPDIIAGAGRCVHLAAVVGVDRYIEDPELVLDVNILGGRAVLRACVEHDVPVIIASTSEVYGRWRIDLDESIGPRLGNLANSRWCYSISKSTLEQYAHAMGRRGLRFAIVRYFNVYGPKLDRPGAGRVLGKFLGCVQEGKPLPLVDGGEAVRSFCHIDDAVRGTVGLLDNLDNDKVAGRAFNIGRIEPVTIADLAGRVIALAGHEAGTEHVAGRDHFGDGFEEIERRVPNVSAMREVLGFSADIDLDTGLRQTLEHWQLLGPPRDAHPAATLGFVRPQVEPDSDLLDTITAALQSGQLTNRGTVLRDFEGSLASYLGASEVMATSSGSGALLLATLALAPRGKAIMPAFTYIATLNCAVWAGLEPVFCDIDPHTWTMCPDSLRRTLAAHPDASLVVPVNVYGTPPDLGAIRAVCDESSAVLLYDNAHGVGTERDGARLDPHVDIQVFSLHATKILPAVEGGFVSARDPALMAELRRLCNHGLDSDLRRSKPGFNFKMSELHAAVGRHSLRQLPGALQRRRTYAKRLRAAIELAAAFTNQALPDGVRSNHQNLAVLAPEGADLDAVSGEFKRHGVGSRRYFWPPLHELQDYEGRFNLPVTDAVCARLLCLPMWSRMDDAVLARVESAISATSTSLS